MTIIRRYNDYLPNYLDRFFGRDSAEDPGFHYRNLRPAVNIVENNDAFVLEVAAPGFEKKDFSINVENDELKISAEKETGQDNNYTLREFNYGSFERIFTLPDTVNVDGVQAAYHNGILSVTVPKKEEAKVKPPRLIEIK